ncbi:Wzz/FepE/Etk N-terminal domain-containing protein, partial [Marivita sp.]|uniref:Wzz/FepE/Etk N-terminal domain-containing protein n=1 Tax=Marivita sp. TaxID=2003365 RepID=UPI00321C11EE
MSKSKPIAASMMGDDEIDLAALLSSLWAGKLWVALFSVVAVALGVFYLLITPPTFRADALLQLEEKSAQLSLPSGLSDLVENAPESVTEIEIMRSRMVLGKAVSDLNLDWTVAPKYFPVVGYGMTRINMPLPDVGFLRAYARGGEVVRLDLLQVPPRWLGQEILLENTEGNGFVVHLPDGEVLSGELGQTVNDPERGFAVKIGELEAEAGRHFVLRQISENTAIT